MAIGWEPEVNLVLAMYNKENNRFVSVFDGAMGISRCYLSC